MITKKMKAMIKQMQSNRTGYYLCGGIYNLY